MTPQPPTDAWPDASEASLATRTKRWLYEQRWLLFIFVTALLVRLHWNLVVHPIGDYIFSDMNGYVTRADRMLDDPWTPHEYSGFFPFGTHAMLALFKLVLGKENYVGIGILYALMGATTVAMAYAVARRTSKFSFVPPAVGLVGIFYYPHLSLGGYMLSEVPFCFALTGALLCAVRLVDHGRHRDAWWMGIACGLGALIRPQILLSAGLIGLYWLVRRKSLGKLRFIHFAQSAVPLVLCLGFATTHLHHHTGRRGLVSENGSFNLVFGRCHNIKIESQPDGKGRGRVHFKPPPFLQIRNIEIESQQRRIRPRVALNPAIGDDIEYKGYIGDKEIHHGFIRECLKRTGVSGQLRYTWTNVKLLWLYNIAWPDSGRAPWRPPARLWAAIHRNTLAIPALLGLLWLFIPGPRSAKMGLVSVNLLAILVLAAVFFGGARHRTPYDFVIMTLAFESYAFAVYLALRWWRSRRSRPPQPAPSADSDARGPS